jgi:hypothetical protein
MGVKTVVIVWLEHPLELTDTGKFRIACQCGVVLEEHFGIWGRGFPCICGQEYRLKIICQRQQVRKTAEETRLEEMLSEKEAELNIMMNHRDFLMRKLKEAG